MECTHMRAFEGKELNLRGLIILIWVNFDEVLLVLLDFGLFVKESCEYFVVRYRFSNEAPRLLVTSVHLPNSLDRMILQTT